MTAAGKGIESVLVAIAEAGWECRIAYPANPEDPFYRVTVSRRTSSDYREHSVNDRRLVKAVAAALVWVEAHRE